MEATEMEGRLYTMKLHDVIKLEDGTEIKRVLMGWIYSQHFDLTAKTTSVFVPKRL